MNSDDKAPTRLSVSGSLARYIYEIEWTDVEERYIPSDWYFDRNLYLVRIEVPSSNSIIPAKIIAQGLPWSKDAAIFGPQDYIKDQKPEPMSEKELAAWHEWKYLHP